MLDVIVKDNTSPAKQQGVAYELRQHYVEELFSQVAIKVWTLHLCPVASKIHYLFLFRELNQTKVALFSSNKWLLISAIRMVHLTWRNLLELFFLYRHAQQQL